MQRSILFALVLAIPGYASAQCPTGTALACGSAMSASIADGTSAIGDYVCGSEQAGPETVYTFTCPRAGAVTVHVTDLNCDLDVSLLDGECDPTDASDCISSSEEPADADETLMFACMSEGEVATIVVEAYGFTVDDADEHCPDTGATYRIAVAPDSPACSLPGCGGCGAGGTCMPGDTISACGTGGMACVSCDDGTPCTVDTCDSGVCMNVPAATGSACDDGLYCTVDDACSAAGVCSGGARSCDDAMSCSTDACDEAMDRCTNVGCDAGAGDGGDAGSDAGEEDDAAADASGDDDDDDDDDDVDASVDAAPMGEVHGGACGVGGRTNAGWSLLMLLACLLIRRRRER